MVLHFKGMDWTTYGKLHKEVYNRYQLHGIDITSNRTNMIFLAGKHIWENKWDPNAAYVLSTGSQTLPGVACIHEGKLKEDRKDITALVVSHHRGRDNKK